MTWKTRDVQKVGRAITLYMRSNYRKEAINQYNFKNRSKNLSNRLRAITFNYKYREQYRIKFNIAIAIMESLMI